ncbi:sushi domain-containing protein 1 isoform X2 [Hippoglossus stenolepis]|uniref:sushi domain-containing protein 1 isoform X2 n=1 Tax=Hippoglossus stenolepis TaxID=195615 RepID=UPI00159CC2B1|nr:sushi domain-containing protein 1 isoform X2 [Hippoglossus stenolepis]
MIVFFLLCVVAGMPASGQILDVCASCHSEARCEDKLDGSGKVCNCKYGFVGNGRSFCQDKDECQIGAMRICGMHTKCHNTYGSYDCTCLSGYNPSNNMAIFIPNDGTQCQDIDECKITGLCGDGGRCRNLEGSFECSCQVGYQVDNGTEPFHPHRDKASCKVVDCGQPASVEDTVLLSATGTTYGSVATRVCDEGFIWGSGHNTSVCGADGLWSGPTMVCEDIDECKITGLCGDGGRCRNLEGSFECSCQVGYQVDNGTEPFHPHRDKASCKVVDCGQPASVEDTVLLPATGTTYGSVATRVCDEGFIWGSGHNTSVCGADGLWSGPTMVCEVVDCGQPASVEDTVLLPATGTTYGSVATRVCDEGFIWGSGHNTSVCGADGLWSGPTMVCEEVDCGSPPARPHSHMLWNKSSRVGCEVVYQCNSGYHNVGKGNVSICTTAGQWEEPPVLCQETLCGSPPVSVSTEHMWNGSTAPGSTVLYFCKTGFLNRGGHNISVCNENGQWTPPTLVCQEILCGDPPIVPHTGQVRNGSSTPGSTVTYYCKIGFYHSEGNNVSLCAINGSWTKPNISCKEIDCQEPVHKPHSKILWDGTSHIGSVVSYQCDEGYHSRGLKNNSLCGESGLWEDIDLWCEVVDCGQPASVEDTVLLPATGTTYGSVATRVCDEGFIWGSGHNTSVCGADGLWSGPTMVCEEISCGLPLIHPRTNLLWDRTSRPGSVVLYECMDGFYPESGTNISVCSLSGDWGEISIKCQAKCGPVPFLANSEVVWHNRSVVIHRCVDGYHSWRGSNVSVCGSSGTWQTATLRCIEIKPALSHVHILNEKCVHWKAEKYEEDSEAYKVTYTGTRDYQRSFRDERKQIVSSKAEQLKVCLHLLPATNYSISITALSARFTASITTNTSLSEPPVPFVYYGEFETPVPTLRLNRSANTLDPISLYQVFVLPVEDIMVFDCSSPGSPDPLSENKFSSKYITAQILIRQVGTQMNFTVGDGLHYGGFYNAPLEKGRTYYIILRAVSQWKTALKSSCVLWAKVRGTSYVLMVSSLAAAAAVGLVAFAILGGYSCMWLFKKK